MEMMEGRAKHPIAGRKHFLSILFQHHSVRFTEPVMEIESGPTSQIFLTEIYLKDPLEIDFSQINNDKIALAKQTSTESDQCRAAANVLETSFKVEKYFSTAKLFKQISIDEEEPPGILKKFDHFMQYVSPVKASNGNIERNGKS